ncbi:hypothetical protein FE257_005848 [Aspergillus nanangensis]|uniref:Malonyl-CoA:ACP transacylase (MAT) domain-containing protein n=1 Tax=Aspergillus nanangensis TaxID=2582783 RepID=A0AAD4GWE5_ASPNN|nr:hypothetical protein FE257_005848 [Aspergillus nanangensis]
MESPWSAISSQAARTPSSSPCPVAQSGEEERKALDPYEIVIQDGPIRCSIFLPQELGPRGYELYELFSKSLSTPGQKTQPCWSQLELCSKFMGDILERMDHGSWHHPQDREVLLGILRFVQGTILEHESIHSVLASMDGDNERHNRILRIYLRSCALNRGVTAAGPSRFLSNAHNGSVKPFALFNGQGVETYFDELTDTYEIYQHHVGSVVRLMSDTMMRLAADDRVRDVVPHGLDVETWLRKPESRPGRDYLTTAAVSLPLIGYAQLVQYAVACINLDISPGDLRHCLVGATGHSQGVVIAAFIATADSWDTFCHVACHAIEVLFWIGVRCQQSLSLPVSLTTGQDASPASYMLSVKGLARQALNVHVEEINFHLPASRKIHVALVNGPQQFVIAGTPDSLRALDKKLQHRKKSAAQSPSPSKVPFSQRQTSIVTRFLSIAAPFHSPYLEEAARQGKKDLSSFVLRGEDLAIPVFHTATSRNLQNSGNIIPELVDMVCTEPVQWEALTHTVFPDVTHILDFGPGGDAGIGSTLVSQQRNGTGLRTIILSSLRGTNESVGYAGELYARNELMTFNSVWKNDYAPLLVQAPGDDHCHMVDTKFSRLLGVPPIMVGAMTPTTTSPAFVAAILNAGYHVELACGGFADEASMRQGILSLVAATAPGRSITCNIIYANPRATAWQFPLLAELRRSGIPITGLTIGAGVPSSDVVQGYINELSLEHIAFKPGSKEAIDAVLAIADSNPQLPIMLQWTGGRGGGHHSCEDFHEPILDRYGRIRSRSNVILVAGSGFGDADGTYPYLTGSWSGKFGRPPMPFDAILLGSRVMAAREARTSEAVKDAICRTAGVDDARWEETMQGPAGGIINVKSEMGEPIHKLATRGVMLWAELDRDVFNLPRQKQTEALMKRKQYYITRLNEDFQKAWFGCNAQKQPVDLHEMTYAEVWQRLVALLYLQHSREWIDSSFRTLVWDFTKRMESRLSVDDSTRHGVVNQIELLDDLVDVQKSLFERYPHANNDVITTEDAEYVIELSRRRGQKPVPYIVQFDEDFEYWFKKDSLWQSERLEAVPDQDVGRVCILHGPVAAQYTNKSGEPVKNILDGIHNAHVTSILVDHYRGNINGILANYPEQLVGYLNPLDVDGLIIEQLGDGAILQYSIADYATQSIVGEDWLQTLAGASSAPWSHALFLEKVIVQDRNVVINPIRKLFAVGMGRTVEIHNPSSPSNCEIILKEFRDKQTAVGEYKRVTVARASLRSGPQAGNIILTLWDDAVADRPPVPLEFQFDYRRRSGCPSIHEVMTDRNERIKKYYQTIWVGKELASKSIADLVFQGQEVVLNRETIRQFAHSLQNCNPNFRTGSKDLMHAPLDMAIAVAWKPIMSCLFPPVVTGDMLQLLHLNNSFELCDGVEGLKEGDHLTSEGRLSAIKIRPGSGKVIEAEGVIYRDGTPVVNLRSEFILLGRYTDYETSFEIKTERFRLHLSSIKDIVLLQSRQWILLADKVDLHEYLHKTIEVNITSRYSYEDSNVYSHLSVEGEVVWLSGTKASTVLGSVNFSGKSLTANPVIDYLRRHGTSTHTNPHILDQPRIVVEDLQVMVPDEADQYAQTSGDCNPIHLSELFARYAGHASRVTHGMFTSGLVRGIVEARIAHDNPSKMRSWSCNFEGKVSAGDRLSIRMDHVAMSEGRMVINVRAHNTATGSTVLTAQAVVEQALTAYVFTGQGSQQAGMGMDLDKQSQTAREVWNAADEYFETRYGFSIRHIVRNNPKSLTIHFGGTRGRGIRDNYMSLSIDTPCDNGTVISKPIFPEITKSTRSYTFRSTDGLLHETQFTQPAMALMEIARFQDMRDKGLINEESLFAGHSLGEYMALAAMGNLLSIEKLAGLVFYRGLTMQNAVERDHNGATDYSMCAVDPTRVSKTFTEDNLHWCVAEVAQSTGGLLEIVNYNVANMQYVCAGDLRGLAILTAVMDSLASGSLHICHVEEVQSHIQNAMANINTLNQPLALRRGRATIPLKVNVPFHSSLLKKGVDSFRQLLQRHLPESSLDTSRLIGKYIPNLTGKPFQLSKAYIQEVLDLTKSPVLDEVVRNVSFPGQFPREHCSNTNLPVTVAIGREEFTRNL